MTAVNWSALSREVDEKFQGLKKRALEDFPESTWKVICYPETYPPRIMLHLITARISMQEREEIGVKIANIGAFFDLAPKSSSHYEVEDYRGLDQLSYAFHPDRKKATQP